MADSSVQSEKNFTIRFKQQVISVIDELMKSGLSIRQATDRLQIHHWYYGRWKKIVTRVDDILQKDEACPFNISGAIKKLHLGRLSSSTTIKSNLTCSIFELREQGLQVNTRTV